jgi:hypothetical protein
VIARFHREADENSDLLGYYAASSGNFVPTFRDTFRVQDSLTLKTGPIVLYRIYFTEYVKLCAPSRNTLLQITSEQQRDKGVIDGVLSFPIPRVHHNGMLHINGSLFLRHRNFLQLHITCVQRHNNETR